MNRFRTLFQAYQSMSPANKEIFLEFGSTLAMSRPEAAPARSGRVLPFPRRINAPRHSLDQGVDSAPAVIISEPVDSQ
jgi:hypothetical protein